MSRIFHSTIRFDNENLIDPLFLNSFGYYEQINTDITVSRPNGRKDFQILYVSNGKMKVNDKIIKNGEFYLLIPNEPQNYTYYALDNSKYFWVHFTGNKVTEMIKYFDILHGVNPSNGFQHEIETIFQSLFSVNSHDALALEKLRLAFLHALFPFLGACKTGRIHFSRAEKLLSDTTSNVSINELAEMYNITPEHFIRSFKSVYGRTPSNYRIVSRINQAKNLLIDTLLSINEITDACCFTDSYYFSRIFKKYVGMTPTEYRKKFTKV